MLNRMSAQPQTHGSCGRSSVVVGTGIGAWLPEHQGPWHGASGDAGQTGQPGFVVPRFGLGFVGFPSELERFGLPDGASTAPNGDHEMEPWWPLPQDATTLEGASKQIAGAAQAATRRSVQCRFTRRFIQTGVIHTSERTMSRK